MIDINKLVDFFENKWASWQGLVAAEIISIFSILKVTSDWDSQPYLAVISFLAILGAWWRFQQPPKTESNKVGFLVAISCPDPNERRKIQEDFVLPLQKSIGNGRLSKLYDFINIPEHIAKKVVTADDAQSLRIKAKAHFIIYGSSKVRKINGVDTHVIHLDAIVTHQPIPTEVSNSFAKEFGELLPRRLNISEEVSFQSLEFTSEWAELTSKYIIAVAALISGDIKYSEILLNEVKDLLLAKNANFPIYKILKDRTTIRLSEIQMARARWSYESWCHTNDPQLLIATQDHLNLLDAIHKTSSINMNLQAILNFQLNKDIEGSIKQLKQIPKVEQLMAWHLNMAFLYGCLGKLSNAVRYYRLALKQPPEPDAIGQIEQFIDRTIKNNPNWYQLHYCLGIFNLIVKGDFQSAKLDFDCFIKNPDAQNSYPTEYKMTLDKWMPEIEKANPHHF